MINFNYVGTLLLGTNHHSSERHERSEVRAAYKLTTTIRKKDRLTL